MSTGGAQEPASVLLVDDQPSNLLYLRQVLGGPEYDLVLASSGVEALERIQQQEFAAVLLDVAMPGMDGFEVATAIQQRGLHTTPVIFVTASMEAEWVLRAYSLGAVDFLHKPLDRHVVRGKVAVFAQLFRQRKQIERQALLLQESERRERELELTRVKLEHERQYRNLAEALPNVIWKASPEGQIDYLNRRWSRETGLDESESLGEGWRAALHPDDSISVCQQWRLAIETASPLHLECRFRSPDGSFRWFLCRALAEVSGEGRPVRWIGSFTDIHEEKQAHENSRAALRLRDEFLAIASHELRTPLTALQLQVAALASHFTRDGRANEDPRAGGRVEAIGSQVRRLSNLIDRLLDVSRIRAGQLKIEPQQLDLVGAAREVVDRFTDSANRAGSALQFHGQGPLVAFVDHLRFEQVLTNLVSNAIKYGAGQPIEVAVAASDNATRISVRDSGVGIAPEHLERIFGRFERAAPMQNYGGLGLGLYVAREIMLAHGGTLEVSTTPGAGATFTATFPTCEQTTGTAESGAAGA